MTNETKQTAVEWLKSMVKDMINNGGDADLHAVLWHIEQAKEMDKEQKEFMFNCGRQYQLTGEGTFTEVYNETYEGNK